MKKRKFEGCFKTKETKRVGRYASNISLLGAFLFTQSECYSFRNPSKIQIYDISSKKEPTRSLQYTQTLHLLSFIKVLINT
jgi:hypothetical protein